MINVRAYEFGTKNNRIIDFDINNTVFPDGTHQIWKLHPELFQFNSFKINWYWQNYEAELFHVVMLNDLLRKTALEVELYVPYLPFARQDKKVSNDSTFALHSFAKILNSCQFSRVTTFDVHSSVAYSLINNFYSVKPTFFHKDVIKTFHPDIIFYPDKGAAQRYIQYDNEIVCYGEKIRDQLTGEIVDYNIVNQEHFNFTNKKVLIIDDICDGGATFITAAKSLKELEASEVGLCVSHGIFSKGFDNLEESGIKKFYTTNSFDRKKFVNFDIYTFNVK